MHYMININDTFYTFPQDISLRTWIGEFYYLTTLDMLNETGLQQCCYTTMDAYETCMPVCVFVCT